LIPRRFASTGAAVDPFVQHCGVTYVDECRDDKQVLLNYMGWLRKQPVAVRKRSDGSSSNNPKRTLANKVGDVRIFLKSLGISSCLTYYEKRSSPKRTTNSPCSTALTSLSRKRSSFLLN
jgi:hypothetical protein